MFESEREAEGYVQTKRRLWGKAEHETVKTLQ